MTSDSSKPAPKQPYNRDLDFGQELWKIAHSSHLRENQTLSPLLADVLMGLISFGAKGSCQQEIRRNIKLPCEVQMTKKLCELMKPLYNTMGVRLHVVTGIYAPWKAKFKKELAHFMELKYHGEMKSINYSDPYKARALMNAYFAHGTGMMITQPLKQSDITQHSQLTLVSCIYFKGLWKQNYTFRAGQTELKPFMTIEGTYVDVNMMSATFQCMFASIEEYDCRAIGIPYEGDQFTFVIVLPNDPKGLPTLEKEVNSNFFQEFRSILRPWPHDIHVEIPKFAIKTRHDLIPALKSVDLRTMFGPSASFGGYFEDGKGPYRFTTIIQEVHFEISEEGGRSHHVFQSVFGRTRHSEDFCVHHPFLFFVTDDKADSVLLAGSVSRFEPISLADRTKSGRHLGFAKSVVDQLLDRR